MLGNCEGASGALVPHAEGAIADARGLVGGRRARAQRPGKRYAHTPPDYERHDTNFRQNYRRAREDSVVVRPARKVKRSSRAALFRPVPPPVPRRASDGRSSSITCFLTTCIFGWHATASAIVNPCQM